MEIFKRREYYFIGRVVLYRSDGNAQREALGRDLDVLAVAG